MTSNKLEKLISGEYLIFQVRKTSQQKDQLSREKIMDHLKEEIKLFGQVYQVKASIFEDDEQDGDSLDILVRQIESDVELNREVQLGRYSLIDWLNTFKFQRIILWFSPNFRSKRFTSMLKKASGMIKLTNWEHLH